MLLPRRGPTLLSGGAGRTSLLETSCSRLLLLLGLRLGLLLLQQCSLVLLLRRLLLLVMVLLCLHRRLSR